MLAFLRRFLGASAHAGEDLSQRERQESGPLNIQVQRLIELGNHASRSGEHERALQQFEEALALAPESATAYAGAGNAALALDDLDAAHDYLTMGLHYAPQDAHAALVLARVWDRRGRGERGVQVLEEFLARSSRQPAILLELARRRYASGAYGEAVQLLRECLEQNAVDAESLNLLGLILAREFGELQQGEAHVRRALSVLPGFSAALSNLGWILAEQGRVEEALICFDRVLQRDPQDSETRLMIAHTHLKQGNFTAGWKDFEARHHSPLAVKRSLAIPVLPEGDDPSGTRLLIVAEQGLGDQIMFASCIPDLLRTGAQCTVESDARLVSLFQRSFPEAVVRAQAVEAARAQDGIIGCQDFYLPMGSLPGRFRKQIGDFPQHAGYLRPDEEKTLAWRDRLRSLGPGPYVGVSWRGGSQSTRRQLRSIPLPQWSPVLARPGCFINLQYGECDEDLAEGRRLGLQLHHWPKALADYDETAALVAALDLVVSVCTAVVHLAGALGKPVWILAPATPEWRYLQKGQYLPWYPSARIFRQRPETPWTAVLARVSQDLAGLQPN